MTLGINMNISHIDDISIYSRVCNFIVIYDNEGTAVVKGLLPRMLLLWRNSFPRSNKELESEKARGDAFTWQVTLEGRAGALSAMYSFLLHCPELLNDDITRRLLTPIESALAMLTKYTNVLMFVTFKTDFMQLSYECFF